MIVVFAELNNVKLRMLRVSRQPSLCFVHLCSADIQQCVGFRAALGGAVALPPDVLCRLQAWAEGRTGYPFIDAIMTQLRREGWIHHLARHAVACFLTRGDLFISWEEGMKVGDRRRPFNEQLIMCFGVILN